MKKSLLIASLIAIALAACAKAPEPVSHQTLEDARARSLENGVTVAKAYVRENPRLAGMDVVGHADDVQTSDCPQGSGWTHLSAMKNDPDVLDKYGKPTVMKVKLVCSTVSASLGCYREEDFKGTKFYDRAGQCDSKLPFPLPKVVGKS